ncbi:unannotated protein [freshwater metagenome]|uniref:Unannotated protein n=1 Tax=freshwater metagenome TaxID=449393 RepID=A0A6J7IFK8_9ZZZZ
MPFIVTVSGTTGLGWCTWYSGIRRTPSRCALPCHAFRTSFGNGATGSTFEARTTSSRSAPSAAPRIRSLLPGP